MWRQHKLTATKANKHKKTPTIQVGISNQIKSLEAVNNVNRTAAEGLGVAEVTAHG